MSPVQKAIIVYRIDAAVAFLATAALLALGLADDHPATIIFTALVGLIPALVGFAALLVATGLRAGAPGRVARGANVVRAVLVLTATGIGLVEGRLIVGLLSGFSLGRLLGGLLVLAFLFAVGALTWYSFSVLAHPEVRAHLAAG